MHLQLQNTLGEKTRARADFHHAASSIQGNTIRQSRQRATIDHKVLPEPMIGGESSRIKGLR